MLTMTFTGRIGRNAETRHLQDGTPATSFSVATDTGYGDKKKTVWIDCTIWKDRGVNLRPYLTKGQAVTIQGFPSAKQYEVNGESRVTLACSVDQIELQGGKKDDTGQDAGGGTGKGWDAPGLDDEVPW